MYVVRLIRLFDLLLHRYILLYKSRVASHKIIKIRKSQLAIDRLACILSLEAIAQLSMAPETNRDPCCEGFRRDA